MNRSFVIRIDMDNAAFEEDAEDELARILDDLAVRLATRRYQVGVDLDQNRTRVGIWDVNGNLVGRAQVVTHTAGGGLLSI